MEEGLDNVDSLEKAVLQAPFEPNEDFSRNFFRKNSPTFNFPAPTSKPSTAGIDLGASLAGDSQFIFPIEGARPIRTPGALSDANTNVTYRSDIMTLPSPEERGIVSEIEDVASRNSRRLHLLNELENRRSLGENLDVLLGEFLERTRDEENEG